MEKKTIFLELPCELIEKIDRKNLMGDRSTFITNLLEKQLTEQTPNKPNKFELTSEFTEKIDNIQSSFKVAGEVNILDNAGASIGRFDLNTLQGFEDLARKIQEISDDPVVRIRARQWL
jgi:hypothetical protein